MMDTNRLIAVPNCALANRGHETDYFKSLEPK
jgi:hypothetical protein